MVHTASTKEISIGHDKISPKTPAPAATIIVGATHGIKQLVKDFGGNSDQVFRSARLPLSLPSGLAETIPLKRYVMLLEEAAAETKNQDFGFIFGSRFDPRMLGPIGYVLTLSRTVGDALKYFCQYFSCLQDHSEMAINHDGDRCQLAYRIDSLEGFRKAQDTETTIGMMSAFCRRSVGAEWHCSAQFEHAVRSDEGLKKAFLGSPPQYKTACNAIIFKTRF